MPEFMGGQLWYIGMEFVQSFHKGAKTTAGPVVGLVCISLGTVDDLFGQNHFLSKRYRFWSLTQTLPKCIIKIRKRPLPELVFQAVTFHYMLSGISGKIGYMGEVDWDSFIRGLVDIDYNGTLNYETGKTSSNAYGSLQLEYIKVAYQNGLFLLQKYEDMKAKKCHKP